MARTPTLFACVLVCAPLIAAGAGEEMRSLTVYDGMVTLDIPTEWNEIPAETLEFYSLRSAEASGGRVAEFYQFGFRPGDPELDFALPQVLIQIRESGRLPYGQFLALPEVDVLREISDSRVADRSGPMLQRLELNEAAYDRKRHALRLASTLELAFEGRAVVTSVSFLTERGVFIVHCYAHVGQTQATGPIFAHIIDSIRFSDELRYQPRFSDRWPPRPSTVAYTAAAVTALVLLLIVVLQRRKRP